jgi:hypothetical protein
MPKDYGYRSTWEHKFSRALNKARRGGMTKAEMLKTKGRFPKRSEWWGPEANQKEWEAEWIRQNPKPDS